MWNSSFDGFLGSGALFSTILSVGAHTITASVADGDGLSGNDQITVTITAAPIDVPDVTGLLQATAGSTLVSAGLSVGTVTTATSETVPAGTVLSQSPVACTACVVAGSAVDLVVSSGPGNTAPVVNISAPADGSIVVQGTAVVISGTATDSEDGDLRGDIIWTSNKDGALGTGTSITVTLTKGKHTITAMVADSGGLSDTKQIGIRTSKK